MVEIPLSVERDVVVEDVDGVLCLLKCLGACNALDPAPCNALVTLPNAATDARLGAEIYSYARSRGLFLGVSLGGADLSVDHNADGALYGRYGVSPADVFSSNGISIRPEVQQLIADLNAKSGVQSVAQPSVQPVGSPSVIPPSPNPVPPPTSQAPPPIVPIQPPS